MNGARTESMKVYCEHDHRVTGAEIYIADLLSSLAAKDAEIERLRSVMAEARGELGRRKSIRAYGLLHDALLSNETTNQERGRNDD
jgi:hypothetical protein